MIVATLAAVCFAGAVVPGVALATLWVGSGGTDTGYCSQANPCATISRAVSLAIPNDTIYVGAGRFTDHVTVDSSIGGLTIQGAGMHATIVSGGVDQPGSVFTIQSGATATIEDLSITGGQAPDGGGVDDAGALTLARDEVAFNSATGTGPGAGFGGGIYAPGSLTVTDSAIFSNQAATGGGGVSHPGTSGFPVPPMTLARDLVARNTVMSAAGFGGGVLAFTGLLAGDTIVANQVVDSLGNPGGDGGGVRALGVVLSGDTITANTAASAGGVSLNLEDRIGGTIIAANHGGNCRYASSDEDFGYNLEDDPGASCGFGGPLDLVGMDPKLGPLADNGGPTQTIAIPASSPAYDFNAACNGTDQRGVSRLQRGAQACDIGAYQVSAPTTYVANPPAGSVTAYAQDATGDASPTLTLLGLHTRLSHPTGVVVDVTGRVFVANSGNNSITEYAPETTGDAAPVAKISGALTGLNRPQDLALDASGQLFVTNSNASVTEYAPNASGNVAPTATITGSSTGLVLPRGIAIDPSGALRVSNANATVNTYAAGANGNVAPVSRLSINAGAGRPFGLNFDPQGDLVLADAAAGRVDTFAAAATGSARPLRVLSGAPPGLKSPAGLDLDVFGDVFVANHSSSTVNEYPPASTGAAVPMATIAGPDTGLSSPFYLSELPPPPAPHLHASTGRRQYRKRILRNGIIVRLRATGRLAFRSQPVSVAAHARAHRRTIARAKAAPLRPGLTRIVLIPLSRAARVLRGRHIRAITTIITVRDGAGVQTRRLTIRLR
jgi:6-phosphogluconolactonase (cycloisomerase 2 family)